MNASKSNPMMIGVHHELMFPWNVMMVWIMPKMSTPTNVPANKPTPPLSNVPPTTTAAIASSSRPFPAVGFPDDV